MLGLEALWLQGIWSSSPEKLPQFSDDLLKSLAGNAYDAHSYAASVFSSLIFLSSAFYTIHQRTAADAKASKEKVDQECSDSDDSCCLGEFWEQNNKSDSSK